jgi:DNA-binding beta-propeller fold protein YncE
MRSGRTCEKIGAIAQQALPCSVMKHRVALLVVVFASTLAAALPPSVKKLPLPGAAEVVGLSLDFIAVDRTGHRVWVPAGGTGSVDVLDTLAGTFTRVEGFPTAEVEVRGNKRVVGPSSVTLSEKLAFVGNRADNSVCAVDRGSLAKGACVTLSAMPDALAYIAAKREVWATTPRAKTIAVLSVTPEGTLAAAGTIAFEGEPEGYAVDEGRHLFYTNLEDADRTLAIDFLTRKVVATWKPECGEGGPKGLALDTGTQVLVVACPDHIVALDAGHDGKRLGEAKVGAGVDNIDYLAARHEVFVAAGRDGKLAVFRLDAKGTLEPIATVQTAEGARTVVADAEGTAYVVDPRSGGILVVKR